jgi:hypothetical protein
MHEKLKVSFKNFAPEMLIPQIVADLDTADLRRKGFQRKSACVWSANSAGKHYY